MKKFASLFCAALMLLCIAMPAFAAMGGTVKPNATMQKYCGKCGETTTWKDYCSGMKSNDSGYHTHDYNGRNCNYYYTYYKTYFRCSKCRNNTYKPNATHMEIKHHEICGQTRNICSLSK